MSIIMISLSVTGLLSFLLIVLFLILENVSMQKKVKALSEKINNLSPELKDEIEKVKNNNNQNIKDINQNIKGLENKFSFLQNNMDESIDSINQLQSKLNQIKPNSVNQTATKNQPFQNSFLNIQPELNTFLNNTYLSNSSTIMNKILGMKSIDIHNIGEIEERINSICYLLELSRKDNEVLKPLSNYFKKYFSQYYDIIFPVIGECFDNEIMEPAKILGGNNKVQSLIQFGIKYKNEIIKKAVVYVQ